METTLLSMGSFFEFFGWREALDILLIALALFLAYRTFRRLGTWKILAGILLAAAVFFAASLLQLRGLEWIFSTLSPVAMVALIVIFQPEIRKIFERAASLHRQRRAKRGGGLAGTIAEAAFALAEQRVGAILVLPGRESIAEWIHGGQEVDGQVSMTLLQSIFDAHSPGHDGAVIVENGRLSTLGVRLPMSRSDQLPAMFGTRHHAAAGLSEVTDALVAAVSEERGTVMLFSGGRGRTIESRDAFEAEVIAHWQRSLVPLPVRSAEGGARNVVFSLLGAMILALFFWSAVVLSQYEVRERMVIAPIEYNALPAHMALGGEKQNEARLHLAGPVSELDRLDPFRLRVTVDLAGALPGTQTVVITESNVSLPRGISLLDADPAAFDVTLNEIRELDYVVQPQLVGALPDGLVAGDLRITPQSVRVRAAAGEASGSDGVLLTTPIYLGTISETTTLYCKIIAPPSIQPVGGQWPDVAVVVVVKEKKK
jgi:diadenylate cyclase